MNPDNHEHTEFMILNMTLHDLTKWPGNVPHLALWFFIFMCLWQPAAESQPAQGFRQGSLGVTMKTVCSLSSPPQHKWPCCLPSTLTGKVKACVSAFSGDRLVCHTYFHHIKSYSSFSQVVIGKVSLDNILFISELMAEIALRTEYCFLNVTLVCHKDIIS